MFILATERFSRSRQGRLIRLCRCDDNHRCYRRKIPPVLTYSQVVLGNRIFPSMKYTTMDINLNQRKPTVAIKCITCRACTKNSSHNLKPTIIYLSKFTSVSFHDLYMQQPPLTMLETIRIKFNVLRLNELVHMLVVAYFKHIKNKFVHPPLLYITYTSHFTLE